MNTTNQTIQVHKQDQAGNLVWTYETMLITRGDGWIEVEGLFNRDDRDDGYTVWRRGDRLREWFYADRWYNIFEVHNVGDDALKGWYCNITRPAIITVGGIAWADLALDLWVDPAGTTAMLDEEEYQALPLSNADREQVNSALSELIGMVKLRAAPFDRIMAR